MRCCKGGQLLGVYALTAIVTLGPSYLLQKGFLIIGFALVAVAIGLMAWPVFSLYLARRSGPPSAPEESQGGQPFAPLADDENAPLETVEVDGVQRLRHPALGFSLLHPGADYFDARVAALEMDMELGSHQPGGDLTKSYVYEKKRGDTTLTIVLMKGSGGTAEELREVGSSMEEGTVRRMRTRLGPNVKVERLQGDLVWDANRRLASRHFVVANIHCRIRAHALQLADRPPFIVVLFLTSREPGELDKVLESFRTSTDETAQLR